MEVNAYSSMPLLVDCNIIIYVGAYVWGGFSGVPYIAHCSSVSNKDVCQCHYLEPRPVLLELMEQNVRGMG